MTERKSIPIAEYVGKVTVGDRIIPCAALHPESANPIPVFWNRETTHLPTRNKQDALAGKWAKKFKDDFYKEIFRLNNWKFNPTNFTKRPGVIGKWTVDIIYARFPPSVLGALYDRNPLTEKGYRRHKLHTLLTDDIGNP